MIRAVIFDLDGVICHTDEFHYEAWAQIAAKLGVVFTRKDNNRLRGVSRMDSLEIVLESYNKHLSQEEKENLAQEKNEIYKQKLLTMTMEDVTNDTRKTLTNLRNKGYKLAIGSSSRNAQLILAQTNCIKYFDAICDGNAILNSKPHPEVFLKAAEMLEIEPEACAVIEDAQAGILAALKAGCTAIAIGKHAGNNAHFYITALEEIPNILVKA